MKIMLNCIIISSFSSSSFNNQISSAACISCEFSAGTVQVGLFFLPLIGRLRLMVFCAIFSLLLTSLMVFLDISHIALMFPFNWPKLVGFFIHIFQSEYGTRNDLSNSFITKNKIIFNFRMPISTS